MFHRSVHRRQYFPSRLESRSSLDQQLGAFPQNTNSAFYKDTSKGGAWNAGGTGAQARSNRKTENLSVDPSINHVMKNIALDVPGATRVTTHLYFAEAFVGSHKDQPADSKYNSPRWLGDGTFKRLLVASSKLHARRYGAFDRNRSLGYSIQPLPYLMFPGVKSFISGGSSEKAESGKGAEARLRVLETLPLSYEALHSRFQSALGSGDQHARVMRPDSVYKHTIPVHGGLHLKKQFAFWGNFSRTPILSPMWLQRDGVSVCCSKNHKPQYEPYRWEENSSPQQGGEFLDLVPPIWCTRSTPMVSCDYSTPPAMRPEFLDPRRYSTGSTSGGLDLLPSIDVLPADLKHLSTMCIGPRAQAAALGLGYERSLSLYSSTFSDCPDSGLFSTSLFQQSRFEAGSSEEENFHPQRTRRVSLHLDVNGGSGLELQYTRRASSSAHRLIEDNFEAGLVNLLRRVAVGLDIPHSTKRRQFLVETFRTQLPLEKLREQFHALHRHDLRYRTPEEDQCWQEGRYDFWDRATIASAHSLQGTPLVEKLRPYLRFHSPTNEKSLDFQMQQETGKSQSHSSQENIGYFYCQFERKTRMPLEGGGSPCSVNFSTSHLFCINIFTGEVQAAPGPPMASIPSASKDKSHSHAKDFFSHLLEDAQKAASTRIGGTAASKKVVAAGPPPLWKEGEYFFPMPNQRHVDTKEVPGPAVGVEGDNTDNSNQEIEVDQKVHALLDSVATTAFLAVGPKPFQDARLAEVYAPPTRAVDAEQDETRKFEDLRMEDLVASVRPSNPRKLSRSLVKLGQEGSPEQSWNSEVALPFLGVLVKPTSRAFNLQLDYDGDTDRRRKVKKEKEKGRRKSKGTDNNSSIGEETTQSPLDRLNDGKTVWVMTTCQTMAEKEHLLSSCLDPKEIWVSSLGLVVVEVKNLRRSGGAILGRHQRSTNFEGLKPTNAAKQLAWSSTAFGFPLHADGTLDSLMWISSAWVRVFPPHRSEVVQLPPPQSKNDEEQQAEAVGAEGDDGETYSPQRSDLVEGLTIGQSRTELLAATFQGAATGMTEGDLFQAKEHQKSYVQAVAAMRLPVFQGDSLFALTTILPSGSVVNQRKIHDDRFRKEKKKNEEVEESAENSQETRRNSKNKSTKSPPPSSPTVRIIRLQGKSISVTPLAQVMFGLE